MIFEIQKDHFGSRVENEFNESKLSNNTSQEVIGLFKQKMLRT